jgi:hypothetical protein
MNRLSGMIGTMSYNELKALEKDLYEGNIGLNIKKNLEKFNRKDAEKTCPTCENVLLEDSAKFILVFGPPSFRKRAFFCEQDCLDFFLAKLKSEKSVEHEHQDN